VLRMQTRSPPSFMVVRGHFSSNHHAITPEWSLALIGDARAQFLGGADSRSEAFSMGRLEGSRWCLRRLQGTPIPDRSAINWRPI
jgi:hypothetical protein